MLGLFMWLFHVFGQDWSMQICFFSKTIWCLYVRVNSLDSPASSCALGTLQSELKQAKHPKALLSLFFFFSFNV